MSQIIHTIDGPGVLLDVDSFHGSTQYRVAGNGFEGWYASHEILSEVDDTTTETNFEDDTDPDGTNTQYLDEDDPHKEDGTELPWTPESNHEFDGEVNIQPDEGDYVDITPGNSTDGADFSDDPEFVATPFPREAANEEEPQRESMEFEGDGPWYFDNIKKDWVEGEKPEDDWEPSHRIQGSSTGPTPAFMRYLAFLDNDPMARQAAWTDVRRKAKRLLDDGSVQVRKNNGREITAVVIGDHGNYNTQVDRKNAHGQTVSYWNCTCPWGAWAYRRQRTFVGRMCAHGLATYYAMQANQQPLPMPWQDKKVAAHEENESLAARQGGLMIWDDELSKVLKPLFNGQQPGQGGPQMNDPSAMGMDPSMMGGAPPAGADPTMAGQPDPTQDPAAAVVRQASSYPARRVLRHEFSEYDDSPSDDDDFEDPSEPNADDAETFNDIADLPEDNDDEQQVHDSFWNKSSAVEGAFSPADLQRYYEEERFGTGHSAPGQPGWPQYEEGMRPGSPLPGEEEEDHEWRTFDPREASVEEEENLRVAENFNDNAEEIVRKVQARTAGRNFSFAEQQELIDEDGTADQLPNLDLAGTFYED